MTKKETYQNIYQQILAVTKDESDLIANLANVVAIIQEAFHFHWSGFYLVKDKELVLGPFQGPLACTRIAYGKGVCGSTWKDRKSYVVADVHQFEGHIACSALSNSEIVVPVLKNNKVVAVIDIDSTEFNNFDHIDQSELESIAAYLGTIWP
jgi:L-methionine (R)-S-oxide reductase